jgi:hypothetical protein
LQTGLRKELLLGFECPTGRELCSDGTLAAYGVWPPMRVKNLISAFLDLLAFV